MNFQFVGNLDINAGKGSRLKFAFFAAAGLAGQHPLAVTTGLGPHMFVLLIFDLFAMNDEEEEVATAGGQRGQIMGLWPLDGWGRSTNKRTRRRPADGGRWKTGGTGKKSWRTDMRRRDDWDEELGEWEMRRTMPAERAGDGHPPSVLLDKMTEEKD